MTNNETITILLVGVGGQGTILAADLLAKAAATAGNDVKVSEIHGMAQRGGSVTTVVRIGKQVKSMVADLGSADIIVSFETTEALRNLAFLKEGGFLLVNDEAIKPMTVLTGKASMPTDAQGQLGKSGATLIPAAELARNAGTVKASNVVLIGALSQKLPIAEEIWLSAIEDRVPAKFLDANIAAFKAGRAFCTE